MVESSTWLRIGDVRSHFLHLGMNELQLRPRFELISSVQPNDVLRRVAAALAEENASVGGKAFESSAVLKMHEADLRFWSPQLQLSIDPHLTEGSLIHGL